MATNYKIGEVVEIINKGEDAEALTEIGRRFPLLTVKVAKALAGDANALTDLFNAMPDYVTALKVSNGVKAQAGEGDDGEDDGEEEEKPKKKAPAKKAPAKKAAKKPVKKVEEPEEDEEDDEEEAAGKYDGKTPKELYGMCKKRGLDVEPKKAAKVYINALEADDASSDDDEEEEDWDI